MEMEDEIKMGRLIIELDNQMQRQAAAGDIFEATITAKKLTKIKQAFPKLYDKTMLLNK